MQRGQRRMAPIGVHIADSGEIDTAFGDRLADLPDRFDLWRRQAEPLEFVDARAPYRIVMKWIEGREQSRADRRGARGGKLLAAYDRTQPGKTGLPTAQVEGRRPFRQPA